MATNALTPGNSSWYSAPEAVKNWNYNTETMSGPAPSLSAENFASILGKKARELGFTGSLFDHSGGQDGANTISQEFRQWLQQNGLQLGGEEANVNGIGGVNAFITDASGNRVAEQNYATNDTDAFNFGVGMLGLGAFSAAGGLGGLGGGEAAAGGLGGGEAAALPASQIGAMDVAGAGLGAEAASIAPQVAAYESALPGLGAAGTTVGGAAIPGAAAPSWLSSLFGGAGTAGAGAAGGSLWPALIGGGASLLGGAMSANAASKAAAIAAQSGRESLALQERIYNDSMARQQPFLQGGTEDYNRLRALSKGGPEAQQNALQMDPGYQFRLKEGLDKLQHNAAARGGLISGQTLKGAQQYAQDYASNEYGNVYNRLANLANIGPQTAGVMSNLGQNYAQGASNTYNQMGENQGNAALARGSAYQNAFGGIANMLGRYYTGGTFSGQQPYKG